MRLVREHMDYITAEINDIDSAIKNMISSNADYENAVQLPCTIPGVKRDSAIIAIGRMILTAVYQMLSTGEAWNPSDLYKIDMLAPLVEKQNAKAIKQAMKLLQSEGLLPPNEPLASQLESLLI